MHLSADPSYICDGSLGPVTGAPAPGRAVPRCPDAGRRGLVCTVKEGHTQRQWLPQRGTRHQIFAVVQNDDVPPGGAHSSG